MQLTVNVTVPTLHSETGYQWFWEYLLEAKRDNVQFDSVQFNFVKFCLEHYPASYSQLMQDLYVWYRLKGKREGFFVEFGATDGVLRSNTALLEREFKWSGILAEPLPHWHSALKKNRKCGIDVRCVWNSSGQKLRFAVPSDPELATITEFKDSDYHRENRDQIREIEVKTVSLNDLLMQHHAPGRFDYLSVDTEGSEFEILKALDFTRFRPTLITVEHNYHQGRRAGVRDLLIARGYRREFKMFSKYDDWFCLEELA